MSLINDADWIIQHIRREYLHLDDQFGERIITFPSNVGDVKFSYVLEQNLIPERSLCYSPNIQNATSELNNKGLRQKALSQSKQALSNSKDELQSQHQLNTSKNQQPTTNTSEQTTQKDKALMNANTLSNQEESGTVKQVPKVDVLFQRIDVIKSTTSALSAKLKGGSVNVNPFAKDFSFICGKGEQNPINLKVYFPQSTQPKKPLAILVKRDATVEEVIGYSLYVYVEEKRTPALDAKSPLCKSSSWNLRICEDDGAIDEDFPALERSRKIQKFSFDQFAICPANPLQIKANEQMAQKEEKNENSAGQTMKKSGGGNVFLKVHLYSTLEVKQTTTINLPGDMLLSEVLVVCCRKRKIDPNDYTLKMADTKTDIPLDRTLESLGLTEVCLLKKDRGPSAGDIFLRPPEEVDQRDDQFDLPTQLSDEYTSVYKKYTVTRKMPMIMGRQERILAIDGDYIYIMPPENKNLFDTVRTTSFHASTVISCKQVKKLSSTFRLTCHKDRDTKTFEFEASTPQEASIA